MVSKHQQVADDELKRSNFSWRFLHEEWTRLRNSKLGMSLHASNFAATLAWEAMTPESIPPLLVNIKQQKWWLVIKRYVIWNEESGRYMLGERQRNEMKDNFVAHYQCDDWYPALCNFLDMRATPIDLDFLEVFDWDYLFPNHAGSWVPPGGWEL